jgi:hypothetical protein
MLRAVHFWWQCVREAAVGTIEKANAWFWLIGIPLVSVAGRYWEVGELTIPDTVPGFLTFMVVTTAATWIVFFITRLIGAAAHLCRVTGRPRTSPLNFFTDVAKVLQRTVGPCDAGARCRAVRLVPIFVPNEVEELGFESLPSCSAFKAQWSAISKLAHRVGGEQFERCIRFDLGGSRWSGQTPSWPKNLTAITH